MNSAASRCLVMHLSLPFPASVLAMIAAWLPIFAADPAPAETERLVRQLGSTSFRERQAATRALESSGESALPPLRRAAADSRDIEVRRRAGGVVQRVED